MVALSAVVGAVGVGLLFVQWSLAIAALVVAVSVLFCALVVVRADDQGVRVGFGPLHWPAASVALEDIASARAEHVEPLRSGGCGYRLTPRGRAIVVRRGEGLPLERTSGQDLVVTVDGAEEAAEVVNALIARRHDATRLRGNA